MHRRYLALLLVLSGACGLAYELIWVRMLSLSFGSTTQSFSTVIAVFLGGLALGSWLGGRSARVLANPVRTYALLELGTGLIGALSFPLLRALPELFSHVDPGVGTLGVVLRLAVAILVLLPPTLLMGATLPAACAACVYDDERLGPATATLYGVNTLGACLGTYGVTYLLFPAVGVSGAVACTVATNALVGTITLLADRARLDVAAPDRPVSASTATSDGAVLQDRRPYLLAFLAGLAAVAAQVVWSRLFSSILMGTIYGVGAVLVAILVGIGLGSMVVSRALATGAHAARAFVVANVLLILSLLFFWWALPWIQYEIQVLGGGLTGRRGVHAQLAMVVVALLIPAATSGAVLPILVRVVAQQAAAVPGVLSRLYASNTVGSVLGSLLGGFVLLPAIGTPGTAYLTTVLVALTTALGAISLLRDAGALRYLVAVAAVASTALFPDVEPLGTLVPAQQAQSLWEHRRAVDQTRSITAYLDEGRVASVLVTGNADSRSLTLNGLGQGSYSVRPPHHILESLLVAQVPMLHTTGHEDALLVGLGAGTTVDAMLQMGVDHVRVLELEPSVLTAQSIIFGEHKPTDDPRVEVIIDDARHHLLLNARTSRRFDIITSMPAHPWVAAPVFTEEFFRIAHDNLKPNGVFTAWFGLHKLDDAILTSILNAFAAAFPHHVIYYVPEVGALYLVGSPAALTLDPRRFAELAATPPIAGASQPIGRIEYFLRRVLTVGTGQPLHLDGPDNTDLTIYAEAHIPLTAGATLTPGAALPRQGFDPVLLPPADRARLTSALLDELLGTPEGRWPAADPGRVEVATAETVLARAREFLSADEITYFTSRLGAAKADRAAAVETLTSLARGGGPVAARAGSMAAMLEADPARRGDLIASLLASGVARSDLWLRALDGPSRDAAIQAATTSTLSAAHDPLGWLIAASVGARLEQGGPRGDVLRAVGPLARGAAAEALVNVCLAASEAAHLPELVWPCRSQRDAAQKRQAKRRVDEAIRAGRARNYAAALDAFEAAHKLDPLDPRQLELFLSTALRANDARRTALVLDELRFRGTPPTAEAELLERSRRAASKPDAP